MAREEIGERTGLRGDDLDRARRREYDEPFVADRDLSPAKEKAMHAAAANMGLRVTRGGRFFHLMGQNDKGMAARRLKVLYLKVMKQQVVLMGLGDSANDLEMLESVDRPVVVARPDSTHDALLQANLPRATFTRSPGPAGFSEAVFAYLKDPW